MSVIVDTPFILGSMAGSTLVCTLVQILKRRQDRILDVVLYHGLEHRPIKKPVTNYLEIGKI